MRISLAAPLLAAMFLCTPVTEAASGQDLIKAETFAKLPTVRDVQFSPDASYIAYTSPIKGRINLIIRPLAPGAKADAIPPVEDTDINWFHWINNHRLIVAYRYTNDVGKSYVRSALFSVDVKKPGYVDMARDPKQHDRNPYARQKPQIRDRVIDFLPNDPQHFLLAIDSDFDGRAEIRKVDVETGRYTNVTQGYDWIRSWVTDQNHQYRLGWGMGPDGEHMVYIDPDGNKKRNLADIKWYSDDDINPLGFTENPHIAYAADPYKGGPRRLITFNVVTGKRVKVLFDRPDASVQGLVEDPKTGKPIGFSYIDDLYREQYFDKDLAALQAQLDRLLHGGSNIIRTANREKQLYMIEHFSDREDTYYLVDMAHGRVQPFARNVLIPPQKLSPTMKQVIKARDGVSIPSYLTLPVGKSPSKLPMVVLPHGGPQSRDTLGYYYLTQFLASRGYAVLRPNFRGSAGFGKKFMEAGKNQWGGKMQDDVTDATKWAITQGIADPKRICIVGGSYGGYAAYMGVIKEPGLYRCAVSLNGVANLKEMASRARNLFWFKDFAKTMGHEGEKVEAVSPVQQAGRVSAPVLIVHVKDDPVVPYEQSTEMYKALKHLKKPVKMVSIKSGDHFLDTEAARVAFLKPLESFLTQEIGK
ncbi:alpha/beta hydrolase family protein [Kordiimonas marina]|uniref:alpha/beta hydrolase family protein n=1 Tax=Kordiimonas marina TaxID=2872312 RepID=UPI001FF1CEFE|nr:S9 family peptidase [Kordiimonas marina]MCJ9428047.1 S9 family peptidase [Kordiimonas marina]